MAFGNETCKDIVFSTCPYCKSVLEMNKRSFANHVRWCKENPNHKKIKESASLKSSNRALNHYTKVYGEYKDFDVTCCVCNKHFIIKDREFKFDKNKKYFCSRSCANTRHHSEETKEKIRFSLKSFVKDKSGHTTDVYRTTNGIFHYKNECHFCGNCFYTNHKNQKFCSIKCSMDKKHSDYMNKCDLKSAYKKECEFKFHINQYPDEFDFDEIKKYGWYKSKNHGNNINGVSRDHKISISFGFDNLIDPYIISHPANCELLTQPRNASKNAKCSLTLEELRQNIDIWNKKYGVYENKINYGLFDRFNIKFIK